MVVVTGFVLQVILSEHWMEFNTCKCFLSEQECRNAVFVCLHQNAQLLWRANDIFSPLTVFHSWNMYIVAIFIWHDGLCETFERFGVWQPRWLQPAKSIGHFGSPELFKPACDDWLRSAGPVGSHSSLAQRKLIVHLCTIMHFKTRGHYDMGYKSLFQVCRRLWNFISCWYITQIC